MIDHLLVALLIGLSSAIPVTDRLIVGGFETTIEENPWQVSLQTRSHNCGGSIIGKEWILTAAHCANSEGSSNPFSVRVGSSNRTSGGSFVKVKQVYQHENFNAFTDDFDFSLLQLAEPLTFGNTIQSIALASEDLIIEDGDDVRVSGWGNLKYSNESYEYPEILRAVQIPIANRHYCTERYKIFQRPITDQMICAGYVEGGKGSCQGDSGGLTYVESDGVRVLIGLVSWGYRCGEPSYPTVFGRISSVRSWIKSVSGI